jgi:hypothetical protein
MNKNVKTLNIHQDINLFHPDDKKASLLQDVDTTGLSRQQKKKLKKKLKKQLNKENHQKEEDDGRGAQTTRERPSPVKESPFKK